MVIEELYQVFHRFHQCRLKFQKHGELANVEFFMLMGISIMMEKRGGGITLGDIIRTTEMSMSAASKKITILENKGLVRREISERDRRNVYITLTEQGKTLCMQEKEKKRAWFEEVVRRMGKEDTEKMVELINKMFDIMEQMEAEKKGE